MTPTQITLPLFTCACGDNFCIIPYGECHCGCGNKTKLSDRNDPTTGAVKGKPRRVMKGHHAPLPLDESSYVVEDRGYKTPCWIWQRASGRLGYGLIRSTLDKSRSKPAHTAFWENRNGPIPYGLEIDHLCRVPPCVNPDHLEAVTHAVNTQRRLTSKLTLDKAHEIRELRGTTNLSYSELASRFNVSNSAIWGVLKAGKWKESA